MRATDITDAGSRDPEAGGFTLFEMVVVVTVIGMIMAVALPQLMPGILTSKLEGSARHLAGFGRAAMAQSSLMRETVTVKFDLGKQVFWAEHTVVHSDDNDLFKEDGKDADGKAQGQSDAAAKALENGKSRMDDLDLMAGPHGPGGTDLQTEADSMRERFNRFARARMEARARQIKRDDLLSVIDPLKEVRHFSLDNKEEQIEEFKAKKLVIQSAR